MQKRRKARKLAGAEEAQAVTFAEAVIDRGTGVIIGAAGLTIERATASMEALVIR